MQTEKAQHKDQRKMSETNLLEFQALSIDRRVRISRCASKTDIRLFFLPS